ncbi:hypothetical protein CDQ83_11845 [Clostridium thermosuccinogenes]|nr:hypothetical protein CDQ83_11845 [Pseudoclostridium thermosuccinogenes]
MKCKKCNSNLFISYDESSDNIILKCNLCAEILDINILMPSEVLAIINQCHYDNKIKKKALKAFNSDNYILTLIKKHTLYKILSNKY